MFWQTRTEDQDVRGRRRCLRGTRRGDSALKFVLGSLLDVEDKGLDNAGVEESRLLIVRLWLRLCSTWARRTNTTSTWCSRVKLLSKASAARDTPSGERKDVLSLAEDAGTNVVRRALGN